jgi:hypothetical protein
MSEKLQDSSGLGLLSRYMDILKLLALKNARRIEFDPPACGCPEIQSSKHTDGLETALPIPQVILQVANREDRFGNYMMILRILKI